MYKRATKKLAEAETLLVAFTEFEERFKESERARFIYKFGLDHIPTWRAEDLYKKFVAFEKQYGDKEETEDATAGKRRFQYEDEVRKNTLNYDSWFDYVTLIILRIRRLLHFVESYCCCFFLKQVERINYALYGDIETKDVERTQDVYMYTKAYLF
ncbi:crooked neck-like protein 1 isoform X1 [Brassica napus]|uniref:crooked neck-like protein 1 isoform X1 n=1 Tax=Brassica napus TaxID=3708 RepID=UPI00207896A4|nr:crooked neck-like protein 1 isoform X1 [Brassica napus]